MRNVSHWEEIRTSVLELESELDLFSVEVGGVYLWERIRHSTFRTILRKKGLTGQAHSDSTSKFHSLMAMLKNTYVKNPFLASEHDFVFFGSPRRKLKDDGCWWDIYCDPILTELNLDYLYAERPYAHPHKKPPKTENIRYLDLIDNSAGAFRELGLLNASLSASEKRTLRSIRDRFKAEFDVTIDFEEKAKGCLNTYGYKKRLYRRFLRKVDPKIVVIVSKTGNQTRIDVCKELGIPVVELQHGVGQHGALKHIFPEDVTLHVYPDYLLLFGKFWKETSEYPINSDNIYSVGYPYLEREKKKYENVSKDDKLIFLSQGTIGEEMSRFAVQFVQENKDWDVVYKLHPGEYEGWEEKYPWLVDASLDVVDSDSPPLYELLAESKVQVGAYSTVVYEGLNFGLETYLLDVPGVEMMEQLIENSSVSLISSVDDLNQKLKDGTEKDSSLSNISYFFEPNAIQNISEAFEDIIDKEYQDK